MSVTLFAQNLLETAAAVTVSPAASATKPVTRLSDRDRGLLYEGGSAAQTDIDVDLGSAQAVSAWALVNPNATGVIVTLYGDSASPPTTARDSVNPGAAVMLRSFEPLALRYWRVRIPSMAFAPTEGELMLGVPRVITENPVLAPSSEATIGNVARDGSRAGHTWATRLGAKRDRLVWGWPGLSEANLAALLLAFDDCAQGAKKLLVRDQYGVVRWMDWLDTEIARKRIGRGNYEVGPITFQESL